MGLLGACIKVIYPQVHSGSAGRVGDDFAVLAGQEFHFVGMNDRVGDLRGHFHLIRRIINGNGIARFAIMPHIQIHRGVFGHLVGGNDDGIHPVPVTVLMLVVILPEPGVPGSGGFRIQDGDGDVLALMDAVGRNGKLRRLA